MSQTANRVRIDVAILRVLMVIMAALTAYLGATLVTTPLIVPFVIVLWLGALGMLALGLWGKLPTDA